MKRLNHNAFTLIELLVVISIIGVLIALLLPSLKSARDVALGLTCMTRMRTMSTHVETYRNDYKLWYTPNATYNSTPGDPSSWSYFNGSFETLVRPYTNTVLANLAYTSANSVKPSVNPYICPQTAPHTSYAAATVRLQGWIEGTGSVYGNYRINSYFGYGAATDTSNKVNRRCKREIVGDASTMGLMAEWYSSSVAFGDLNNLSRLVYRHGDITNMMFGDGHGKAYKDAVAAWTAKEFRVQQ